MSCDSHEMIVDKIKKLEVKTQQHDEDIIELREEKAGNRILFQSIKDELKDIKAILEKRAERLPTLFYGICGMAIGGIISGVVVWLLIR